MVELFEKKLKSKEPVRLPLKLRGEIEIKKPVEYLSSIKELLNGFDRIRYINETGFDYEIYIAADLYNTLNYITQYCKEVLPISTPILVQKHGFPSSDTINKLFDFMEESNKRYTKKLSENKKQLLKTIDVLLSGENLKKPSLKDLDPLFNSFEFWRSHYVENPDYYSDIESDILFEDKGDWLNMRRLGNKKVNYPVLDGNIYNFDVRIISPLYYDVKDSFLVIKDNNYSLKPAEDASREFIYNPNQSGKGIPEQSIPELLSAMKFERGKFRLQKGVDQVAFSYQLVGEINSIKKDLAEDGHPTIEYYTKFAEFKARIDKMNSFPKPFGDIARNVFWRCFK